MSPIKKYKREVYIPSKLEEKLSRITAFPCTVLTAPIGFGKTTAMREYASRVESDSEIRFLWQTMMSNEGAYFWEDFVGAFTRLDESFHAFAEGGLPMDIPERRRFKEALVALLERLNEEIVFVIDTGGNAFDGDVTDFAEYFIQIIPPGFHLVLLARQFPLPEDSALPYYGLINAVTTKDLTFDIQDIEDYYRPNGVQLTHREAIQLDALTEGWATLVHENLEEMLETGSFLSDKRARQIVDQMVYNQLSPEIKRFVSQMSLCEAFRFDEARYIFPDTDVGRVLDELTRNGLFLSLDVEKQEYRWTNCFASCAVQKSKSLSDEERYTIMNRSGDWNMTVENFPAARKRYYYSKNFEALMQGVENRRFHRPYVEDDYLFISYYTDCPPEVRVRYPKAILTFSKYLHNSNRRELAEKLAQEFLQVIQESEDISEGQMRQYRAMYELLLTYEQYNNLDSMLEHLRNTVRLVEDESDKFIWPEGGLNEVPSILYMYHRRPGEMEREVRLFTEYNMMYTQFTNNYTAGAELVMEAEAQYMQGKSQQAEITIYKARLIANRAKQWCVWVSAIYLQLRIEMDRGNWQKAESFLEEARSTYVSDLDGFSFLPAGDMLAAYVSCKLNQPDTISYMFKPGWDDHFDTNYRAVSAIYTIHAEVMLLRREYVALIALAESYIAAARVYSNLLVEIILEIEIAAAHEKMLERESALRHLENALRQAEPDGIIMPFVEMSQYISHLLPLVSGEIDGAFISAILARSDAFKEKILAIRHRYFANELGGLTQQEVKVARLAADGRSNQEIAALLVVRESTVKTHLTHVFSKLEIEKRSQLRAHFLTAVGDDKSTIS